MCKKGTLLYLLPLTQDVTKETYFSNGSYLYVMLSFGRLPGTFFNLCPCFVDCDHSSAVFTVKFVPPSLQNRSSCFLVSGSTCIRLAIADKLSCSSICVLVHEPCDFLASWSSCPQFTIPLTLYSPFHLLSSISSHILFTVESLIASNLAFLSHLTSSRKISLPIFSNNSL